MQLRHTEGQWRNGPRDTDLLDNFVRLYTFKGDFDGAVQVATHAYKLGTQKDSEDTIPLQHLGHIFQAKGSNIEKVDLYTHAVEKAPATSYLWWHFADCYMRCGNYSGAIQTYKTALLIKGNERCHLIWQGLVDAYEAIGDSAAALDASENGIKIQRQPQLVKDFNRLGTWRGEYDRMIDFYTSELAKGSDSEIEEFLYDVCKLNGDFTISHQALRGEITASRKFKREDRKFMTRFGDYMKVKRLEWCDFYIQSGYSDRPFRIVGFICSLGLCTHR